MTINTDFHSHVSHTSADAMAHAARERGLRVLGLSEHVFQMREGQPLLPHMPIEGEILPFSSYVDAVQSAAQQLHLDVRLGLEVDFIPKKNVQIQELLQGQPWDFLIGSVHQIDGLLFERDYVKFTREQGEAAWLRYFQLLREAISSGYFSFVSHPVRMRTRNPHLPSTLDVELEQLAAEATHYDIALELNGFDVLTYPSLVQRLARACARQKTPISVGSDAHYPQYIACAHAQTEKILREVGIAKIRIWNQRTPEEYMLY